MTKRTTWMRWAGGAAAAMMLAMALPVAAQPLDRDPTSYHILARERAALKNYNLLTAGPGCNIGVNNAGGILAGDSSSFRMPDDTQAVADVCQAGGDIFQCFCNSGGQGFDAACDAWATPILADETFQTFIDACNTLPGGDFDTNCVGGVQDVTVNQGGDCIPGSVDSNIGNGVCDLIPGDYGRVDTNKNSTISFDGGVYNLNEYNGAVNVRVETKMMATMNVCGDEDLKFGDKGAINSLCGNLRVNYRSSVGNVNLGTSKSAITVHVCAPSTEVRLRRRNTIEGAIFARTVVSDANGQGLCCKAQICVPD